jgi:hypothetical protein
LAKSDARFYTYTQGRGGKAIMARFNSSFTKFEKSIFFTNHTVYHPYVRIFGATEGKARILKLVRSTHVSEYGAMSCVKWLRISAMPYHNSHAVYDTKGRPVQHLSAGLHIILSNDRYKFDLPQKLF